MASHISVKSGKNGTISLRLLLDTNVILDFLSKDASLFDLSLLLSQHECFTSVIVKLELLKYHDITPDEENAVNEFLRLVPIIPLSQPIESETIALSRSTKFKLPDAIIGATAIVYGAEVVTNDSHFLECQYEKLKVWNEG
jgi:predicted nucleic acid-binding protein